MPGLTRVDDLGAKLMRELIFSGGASIGDTPPDERLLRQARNLYRDGIPPLLDAAGRGVISVAAAEQVSRWDKQTQARILKGDVKAFLAQQSKGRQRSDGQPCSSCEIRQAVRMLLKDIPDDRLDTAIGEIVTAAAEIRAARLNAISNAKPLVKTQKVSKTLGYATVGNVAD